MQGVPLPPQAPQKYVPQECGGSQICEHERVGRKCKERLGGSICQHKRVRSTYTECCCHSSCLSSPWIPISGRTSIAARLAQGSLPEAYED